MPRNGQSIQLYDVSRVRAMAEQLLEVLRKETHLLAQGDHGVLLEILPEKEALARSISEALQGLRRAEPSSEGPGSTHPAWLDLKEILQHIEALNDANGRYIVDVLHIYQEILSLMVPQTYGHRAPKALPALKGCGLSTEA